MPYNPGLDELLTCLDDGRMSEDYGEKEGGALAEVGYGYLVRGVSVTVLGCAPGVCEPREVGYGPTTFNPIGQDKNERGYGDERSENRCCVYEIVHIKILSQQKKAAASPCGSDTESR